MATPSAQSTLNRPPPPPKPSHLSSAFTGTLNSEALHAYIKAQKTGDSVYGGTLSGGGDVGGTIQPQSSSSSSNSRSGAQSLRNLYEPLDQSRAIDLNADIAIDGRGAMEASQLQSDDTDRRTFIATTAFPPPREASHIESDDDDQDTTGSHSRYVSMASMASVATLRQSDRDTFTTAQEGEGEAWEDAPGFSASEHANWAGMQGDSQQDRLTTLSVGTAHERDESTATVRAVDSSIAPPEDTASIEAGGHDDVLARYSAPSPDGFGERSREPSVLVAGEGGFLRQRDGSLFERAGIATGRAMTPETEIAPKPALVEEEEGVETLAEVPAGDVSRLLPLDIAGPPPVRPNSIALDLDEVVRVAQETDDEEDAQEDVPSASDVAGLVAPASASEQQGDIQAADEPSRTPSQPASVPLPRGRPARALYDFQGEPSFNELTLMAGQCFEILNEELAGGWSLAVVREGGSTAARRGLVPRGWYCYIQDFTMSPAHAPNVDKADSSTFKLRQATPSSPTGPHTTAQSGTMWPEALPYTIGGPSEPLAVSPSTSRAIVGLDISDIVPARTSVIGSGSPSSAGRAERALSLVRDEATPKNSRFASRNSMTNSSAAARQLQGGVAMSSSSSGSSLLVQAIDELGESASSDTRRPTSDMSYASSDADLMSRSEPEGAAALVTSSDGVYKQSSSTTIISGPGASAATQPSAGWRATLFGGRSLNRFSSFVTTGVEDYVISGPAPHDDRDEVETEEDQKQQAKAAKGYGFLSWTGWGSSQSGAGEEEDEMAYEADRHYVTSGPAGPRWKSKATPFYVTVHSPEKRTKLNGMQEYTVFTVTSIFPATDEAQGEDGRAEGATLEPRLPRDPTLPPSPRGISLVVTRRFNQFVWLADVLKARYPLLALPALPSKQYAGRFAADFIETRRADLDLWLGNLVRHPVLRYAEALNFFLSCDDDSEWKKRTVKLAEPLKLVPRGETRRGSAASSSNETSTSFRSRVEAAQKPITGAPAFFANTYHPEFNVDATDAALESRAMERHAKAYERAMVGGAMGEKGGSSGLTGGVMGSWRGMREGIAGTSARYRDLSLSLLRLITGKGLEPPGVGANGVNGSAHADGRNGGTLNAHTLQGHLQHGPPMGNVGRRGPSGATNESGAWCWRDGCTECVALTNALQNTAEALQSVADEYDDHARGTLMRFHERVKGMARPHALYASLLETHNITLSKYLSATGEADPLQDDPSMTQYNGSLPPAPELALISEQVAGRCETVLNVTMAELDRAHSERVEDWTSLARGFLDGQIAHYETVLETLRAAREAYDADVFPSLAQRDPVLPSIYETEIMSHAGSARPPPVPPLPMPSNPALPAGVAASALRPVSLAGEVISEHLFGHQATSAAPATPVTSSYYTHPHLAVNGSHFPQRSFSSEAYSERA